MPPFFERLELKNHVLPLFWTTTVEITNERQLAAAPRHDVAVFTRDEADQRRSLL